MRLVLASASPRRAELLTSAGFTFDVEPVDVDETPQPEEPARHYVLRVARDKAAAWRRQRGTGALACVLTADTVVVAGERILGKPVDADHAREMLTRLSGTTHLVHTGVVVRLAGADDDAEVAEVVTTRVRFVPLTASDIAWYLQTGEAEGKAGAYAIQGRASRFVDWIEGSWSNVVGLPVATVYRLLSGAGVLS
jgi:septum formation protein